MGERQLHSRVEVSFLVRLDVDAPKLVQGCPGTAVGNPAPPFRHEERVPDLVMPERRHKCPIAPQELECGEGWCVEVFPQEPGYRDRSIENDTAQSLWPS